MQTSLASARSQEKRLSGQPYPITESYQRRNDAKDLAIRGDFQQF